jgi:hypothetical protein
LLFELRPAALDGVRGVGFGLLNVQLDLLHDALAALGVFEEVAAGSAALVVEPLEFGNDFLKRSDEHVFAIVGNGLQEQRIFLQQRVRGRRNVEHHTQRIIGNGDPAQIGLRGL